MEAPTEAHVKALFPDSFRREQFQRRDTVLSEDGLLSMVQGRVNALSKPVIEEGDYADFKACALRVCWEQAQKAAQADIQQECAGKRIKVQMQARMWYDHPRFPMVLEMRMDVEDESSGGEELQCFLDYLACTYGFVYRRLTVTRNWAADIMGSSDMVAHHCYRYGSTLVVEAEIVWTI